MTNIFDYGLNNFYGLCVYLMGKPEKYDSGEFLNWLNQTEENAITERSWSRYKWTKGASSNHGSIVVCHEQQVWADWSEQPVKRDSVRRNRGLIDFIKHIKKCGARDAMALLEQYKESQSHEFA